MVESSQQSSAKNTSSGTRSAANPRTRDAPGTRPVRSVAIDASGAAGVVPDAAA